MSVQCATAMVVRCAGMVRTQRGIAMVIHLVGLVLSTAIVLREKRHGRGVRVSRLVGKDDANLVGCGTIEHAAPMDWSSGNWGEV